MLPTYHSGQVLVGWRWMRPRQGSVVVAWLDGLPLIKRVVRIEGAKLWLEGDNPAGSTDSRQFGWVNRSVVEAVIKAKLPDR